MKSKCAKSVWAALAAVALLWSGPLALEAARAAIAAWYGNFLPAMLPFFLLTPFLTGPDAQGFFARAFDAPLRALFRLPGRAAGAILCGLVAGSPAGSFACAAARADMSPGEYERCACIASGLSPAFLITAVGAGLMDSQRVGWTLALSHLCALLLGGLLLRGTDSGEASAPAPPAAKERDILLTAFAQCVRVCGWMVVFGVLCAMITRSLHGYVPRWIVASVCEISGGAGEIARLTLSEEARAVLLAAATGFGGLCVAAQCASATGLPLYRLLRVKALHAALSALFCHALLRLPDISFAPPKPDALAFSVGAAALAAVCVCLWALAFSRAPAAEGAAWHRRRTACRRGRNS